MLPQRSRARTSAASQFVPVHSEEYDSPTWNEERPNKGRRCLGGEPICRQPFVCIHVSLCRPHDVRPPLGEVFGENVKEDDKEEGADTKEEPDVDELNVSRVGEGRGGLAEQRVQHQQRRQAHHKPGLRRTQPWIFVSV